jgi:catechol 2,3-dioxygenase-like lactoylglutathione lyase family enzyme
MLVTHIDHVNVRTANLDKMVDWYERILNMKPGPRPAFSFGGAWMYLGDQPVVHLVSVDSATAPEPGLQLEHFALRGSDLDGFIARLDDAKVEYRIGQTPGDNFPITQVNVYDPDGNHIHIDFRPE